MKLNAALFDAVIRTKRPLTPTRGAAHLLGKAAFTSTIASPEILDDLAESSVAAASDNSGDPGDVSSVGVGVSVAPMRCSNRFPITP